MPHTSRRGFTMSLAALTAGLAAPSAFARSDLRKGAFETLSDAAAGVVSSGLAPGFAVGISGPGFRKMAFHGVSNVETGAALSEQTKFRLASVTKPMTGAAVLRLRDQGALSLDQTLADFFPDFPQGEAVTVRHLLAHTSGIANWWGRLPSDAPADFMDRPQPHRAIGRMTPVYLFEPGTRWSYSNSGYVLLGEIIEQVTNQSYGAAMNSLLFSHCGAGGIELEVTNQTSRDWATGHQSTSQGWTLVSGTPMPFAAGGLRSNLHDTLAFSDALFHARLLSAETLAEMTAHARTDTDEQVQDAVFEGDGSNAGGWPEGTTEMGYGLGVNTWVQHGERFFSHAGLIDGFTSYLVHAPRIQTTIALLSNGQAGTPPLHQMARDQMIAL
jgi:D-alanyl-D-alanine carboxypeptidase